MGFVINLEQSLHCYTFPKILQQKSKYKDSMSIFYCLMLFCQIIQRNNKDCCFVKMARNPIRKPEVNSYY